MVSGGEEPKDEQAINGSVAVSFRFFESNTRYQGDPKLPCRLLVASACNGVASANNRAGIAIKPPPPAIGSTNPATKAAWINSAAR